MTSTKKIDTAADKLIRDCIDNKTSFALVAGAGSGKTTSLTDALKYIRRHEEASLRQNNQQIACITYTNRAVSVIEKRLGFDSLYSVSTLHTFLWQLIGHFQSDIWKVLTTDRLPKLIEIQKGRDNGRQSPSAQKARARAQQLEQELDALARVARFEYSDSQFPDYSKGELAHDDVIEISTYLLKENATFRRIVGQRFPYILVDEAQDTFKGIIEGLNLVGKGQGLPVIGYFGDPWQQIYSQGAATFIPHNMKEITKTENFRCSESVIKLLNAFRRDVQQYAAGDNKGRNGSVIFRLVETETPNGPRSSYTEEQAERAMHKMNDAMEAWGWDVSNESVVMLFLVHRMIARRMGFSELNRLFTGDFASARTQDQFQAGEHFLLTPLTETVLPLIEAFNSGDEKQIIKILRRDSPAFSPKGNNMQKSLKFMVDFAKDIAAQLDSLWNTESIGKVLRFCSENEVILCSERLMSHLDREARLETYDESIHARDKEDWLVDNFLEMDCNQISGYAKFITQHTAYSTQHGVKGEEYPRVVVVYDDTEANWNLYNFEKTLAPEVAGEPTAGQRFRGDKLAYVSFSRATEHLRVLFFTKNPDAVRRLLIEKEWLDSSQIEVVKRSVRP